MDLVISVCMNYKMSLKVVVVQQIGLKKQMLRKCASNDFSHNLFISVIYFLRTYKSIADCYYIKTAKVCGAEAASIMKELVIDVIDSVLCTKCKGIKSNPYVKDAMPAQYLKRSGTQSKVSHIIFTYINTIIYVFQDNSIPIYISTLINLLLIVQ